MSSQVECLGLDIRESKEQGAVCFQPHGYPDSATFIFPPKMNMETGIGLFQKHRGVIFLMPLLVGVMGRKCVIL